MKTKLKKFSIGFSRRSNFTSAIILVLALCLWGCLEKEESFAPLRGSDKTVINTRPPAFVATDSVKLTAEILEIGPKPIVDAGFILSQDSDPDLQTGTIYKVMDAIKTGPYSFVVKNLFAKNKYYYRFYIKDKDQVLLGKIYSFETSGISITRVSYAYTSEPDDLYEGGAGNEMMIQGVNFSTTISENVLKIENNIVPITSAYRYNQNSGSTYLLFTLPENIKPGHYEVSVTRAGQTVKAPEKLEVLPGQWKRLQDVKIGFKSTGNNYSADAFTLDGNGYIAGLLPTSPISLYKYSPSTNKLNKFNLNINSYLSSYQAAFGLNEKVFISAGASFSNSDPKLNRYELQLYSLDPSTGIQEQKQSTPITYSYYYPEATITCFTSGGNAYLGGGDFVTGSWGTRNIRKDFYKYSPTTDTWTRIADFPGTSTTEAVTFEINGIAYLVAPTHNNKVLPEVWTYNPNTNTWSKKSDFPGQLKHGMAGFSIGSTGYLIGGNVNRPYYPYAGANKRDFWKYDPATDTWHEIANFDHSTDEDSKCFVVDGKAYVILNYGTYNNSSSVWEFTPAQ